MSEPKKKGGVAFWATVVVVVVLVGYPISLGPLCWLTSRMNFGGQVVSILYRPLTAAISRAGPTYAKVGDAFVWYSMLGANRNWGWVETVDHPALRWMDTSRLTF
jgi:hypothetical protein